MLPPKQKNPTIKIESFPKMESTTRSGFGDNHATTEDAMMTAHAKQMRQTGHIDTIMEAELRKPWHKSGELHTKYTPAYLATHPNYTGRNHEDIPSYPTALKHQKARDDAQQQLLADFKAGKVDEDGNRIGGREGDGSLMAGIGWGEMKDRTYGSRRNMRKNTSGILRPDVEHTGDTTETAEESSEEDTRGNTLPLNEYHTGDTTETADESFDEGPRASKRGMHGDEIVSSSSSSSSKKSRKRKAFPTTTPSKLLTEFRTLPSAPLRQLSRATATSGYGIQTASGLSQHAKPRPYATEGATSASPILISSLSSPRVPPQSSPTPTRAIAPVTPLPNNPAYENVGHPELVKLCRDRKIFSVGTEPALRNRLVRDDTNVAMGWERKFL